jgi:hypothetical protein
LVFFIHHETRLDRWTDAPINPIFMPIQTKAEKDFQESFPTIITGSVSQIKSDNYALFISSLS